MRGIILRALQYVNNCNASITSHVLQKDITTQRLSKNLLEHMRITLSSPVMFAVLRVFRRIQQYLARSEIEYTATGSVTSCASMSKNSVDYTVAYITKKCLQQIETSMLHSVRAQNPDYNPYRNVRMVLGSLIDYIALKQFDISLKRERSE